MLSIPCVFITCCFVENLKDVILRRSLVILKRPVVILSPGAPGKNLNRSTFVIPNSISRFIGIPSLKVVDSNSPLSRGQVYTCESPDKSGLE